MHQEKYLNRRPDNASMLIVPPKSVMRNGSCGYQASVVNVLELSRKDLIQLLHLPAAREKNGN